MYHKIIVVGNLGRDPELRYTPEGTPVTNFSIAANRRWNDAEGEQHEETVWFRITAWRRMAEVCNEHLKKGRQVLVEGRLIPDPETGGPRIWTGKDGAARASFEVTAISVRFLGGQGASPAETPDAPEEATGADIPF